MLLRGPRNDVSFFDFISPMSRREIIATGRKHMGKGAPEVMMNIAHPMTIPSNWMDVIIISRPVLLAS